MSVKKISQMTKTQIDVIAAHIKNPAGNPLQDKQLEYKLRRLVKADELMYIHPRLRDVEDLLMEIFKSETKSYSRSTAKVDIRDAKQLFGSLSQPQKKYDRMLFADWQIRMMQMAEHNQDMESFNAGMRNLIKILGFDKEDVEKPNYEELQPVDIELGFFPEMMSENVPPEDKLDEWIQRMRAPKVTKSSRIEIMPVEPTKDKEEDESENG